MYEIEVAGRANQNLLFAGNSQVLRGRWDAANVSHLEPSAELRQLHGITNVIPGIRIQIDEKRQLIRVHDPLETTEDGKAILAKIRAFFAANKGKFEDGKATPESTDEWTKDNVKNWLYWMRRALDAGHAIKTPESESLPSLAAIRAMPGKRIAEPFNNNTREDDSRYADIVEDKQPVGARN
jgi:hypothetical protein